MNVVPSDRYRAGHIVTPDRRRTAIPQRFHRIVVVLTALALAAALLAVPDSQAAQARVTGISALHTEGSRLVTESGDDFTIRAVNWFGMETPNCAPHGLWQISLDQAMDQIVTFGFNAIRLPFSSECLASGAAAVSGVDARMNPDLQGLTPLQIMDRVVGAATERNLRVVLDRHRPDSGGQSDLWYTDRFPEQQWIDDWVMLAARYAEQPTVIGADLHNEPHGAACWGCGTPAVDWAAAATRAGNAILAVNPRLLIVVEGVEKQRTAGTTWWGGGLADVAARPIELAVPDQLVYSPHDYPASVFAQTWFADPSYPANLPALWDKNWGFIARQNIAPILLGEFGSKLGTESDVVWLTTLVAYLADRKINFAYWSYNPDSGDTGGLLADDWRTPQQAKLLALAPLLGGSAGPAPLPITPATSGPATALSLATRTIIPPAVTPPAVTPPAVTPPAVTPPAVTPPAVTPPAVTPPLSRPTAASPTAVAPSIVTTPTQTAAAGPGVTASWQLQSSWPDGYVAQLVISASGGAAGWSVSWPDSEAESVTGAWGMNCVLAAGAIRCDGAGWAAQLPVNSSVTVGLQVSTHGTAPTAPPLAVGAPTG